MPKNAQIYINKQHKNKTLKNKLITKERQGANADITANEKTNNRNYLN